MHVSVQVLCLLFQFAGLLIHEITFLRAFGDHNFEEKAAVCGYHTYCYCTVWTPMLGEAMLQVACGSSNSQN